MSALTEIQQAAARAADTVGPSVVRVGRGAGIVVGDGLVLTNAHNVHREEVGLRFADGRKVAGTVAGADVDGDLAVVRADTGDVPAIDLVDAEASVGAAVFGVTPSRHGPRVSFGTVTSTTQAFRGPRGRAIRDAVEHTAPLARGSSGSPIVDADGRVVGLNTHRRDGGFYVALPAGADLQRRIDHLATGDAPARPRLGIAIAPREVARRLRTAVGLDDRDGVLIRGVADDSPARRADLRRGDLITAAGGTAIASGDDLFAVLDGLDADRLTLTVVRGAEELEIVVDLGDTGATATDDGGATER